MGRFLGNRLKSCLRTTAKSGDYLLWNVLPLWEMAIPFPFPVKKPGKNRVRVVFRSNRPDEDSAHTSLARRWHSPQAKRVKPDEAQAARNDGELYRYEKTTSS